MHAVCTIHVLNLVLTCICFLCSTHVRIAKERGCSSWVPGQPGRQAAAPARSAFATTSSQRSRITPARSRTSSTIIESRGDAKAATCSAQTPRSPLLVRGSGAGSTSAALWKQSYSSLCLAAAWHNLATKAVLALPLLQVITGPAGQAAKED